MGNRVARKTNADGRPDAPAGGALTLPELTPRQSEILGWLVAGKTDGEIAEILAISPRTVSHTLARVYRKLGVHNRAAAVAYAVRQGGH
jgi:DNA-binding CsgD family transcriptional regulator